MYHDETYEVKIESDEDGFHLILKCDSLDLNIRIQDVAEQLHDAVRADIAPWLRERDEAKADFRSVYRETFGTDAPEDGIRALQEAAYSPDDPKHPAFHSTHAAIWDEREKGGL